MQLAERFPNLFGLIDNAEETGVFQVLDVAPPFELVGRVRMVPIVAADYLYLLDAEGRPHVPGGMLAPAEMPRAALARELEQHAGVTPVDAALFGGWHLHRKLDAPEAPHLPHPETWTLLYTGAVEATEGCTDGVAEAGGPDGCLVVEVAPLDAVVSAFRAAGREGLAELYWLIDERRRGLL